MSTKILKILEIILFFAVLVFIYILGMVKKYRLFGMSTLEMMIVFIVIIVIIIRMKKK